MSEFLPENHELLNERPLDRELIVGRLQEYGVDLEPEDLEEEDDNEVMGIVATYLTMYDLDIDDVFPEVLPIESRHEKEPE